MKVNSIICDNDDIEHVLSVTRVDSLFKISLRFT